MTHLDKLIVKVADRYIEKQGLYPYAIEKAKEVRDNWASYQRECRELSEEITRIRKRVSNIAEDLGYVSESSTDKKVSKELGALVRAIIYKDMLRLNGMGAISRALSKVSDIRNP